MSERFSIFTSSLLLGLMMLIPQGIAQQKTVKACQEEWRANKSTNQANGVTERVYVAQCRAGEAPSAGPATTAAPTPTAAASPVKPTGPVAGQKTAKACREEWQSNKAANQANGVTERVYVAQCRAGEAPSPGPATTAAPTPTAAAPPVKPTGAAAGQKTVKACRNEWQVNKAANQANGVTERAYVDECRTGTAAAPEPTPTAAPAAPPPTTPTATAPPTRPAPVPTKNSRPATAPPGTPAAANEFSTEALAKARCPSDTVVWVTLKSGIYHFAGTRYYGTTKNGAYMCEADTTGAGMHAAKNETHP